MELILLILKIILIAFLVVFGLIVLLVGIVLFVPIHYEVSGRISDSRDITIKGKVTYLLSILKLLFSYEKEQFDMKFFLFGIEKNFDKEEPSDEQEEVENIESDEEESEVTFHEKSETNTEVANTEPAKSESEPIKQKEQTKSKKKKEKNQKNRIDFVFIKQQLTDEHNKSVIRKIWSELCYLLKHFKFRKIVTDMVFATGDPATTGQALGVLCMIPTLYRYEFKIVPDFEADDAYIKGTFLVAGKVRLIHFLITILRLIFDKEVRLVVKRILALLEK